MPQIMKILDVYPSDKFWLLKIYVLKNIPELDIEWLHYYGFSESVDAFRLKDLETRMKNGCFMLKKTCKIGVLLTKHMIYTEKQV